MARHRRRCRAPAALEAEHDRLMHHEVAFAVFQKPESVGMPVGIVFWRQRDFTGRRNPAEAILYWPRSFAG